MAFEPHNSALSDFGVRLPLPHGVAFVLSLFVTMLLGLFVLPAMVYGAERVALIGDSTTQCFGQDVDPAEVAEKVLRLAPKGRKYRGSRVRNFALGATTSNGWANNADYCIPQWYESGFTLMKDCRKDPTLAYIKRIPNQFSTLIVQLGTNDPLRFERFNENFEDTINNLLIIEDYWKTTRGGGAKVLFMAPHTLDEELYPDRAKQRDDLLASFPFDHVYPDLPKWDGLHLTRGGCAMVGADIAALLMQEER